MLNNMMSPPRDYPCVSRITGSERFIHYAFMPNRLRYCGGDDNRTMFEYGLEHGDDAGLRSILRRFNGALPYLRLIARVNGISDPFDCRVVEAYWLGNGLLERVDARHLYDELIESYGRRLRGRSREIVLDKAPAGAYPHHNFHVFDVHSRAGEFGQSLVVMDQCRISWGCVQQIEGSELIVSRQPLTLVNGKLALGPERLERVARQVDGRGFVDDAQPGDVVSLHWSWACEVITEQQQRNLAHYTNHHLTLANQTL